MLDLTFGVWSIPQLFDITIRMVKFSVIYMSLRPSFLYFKPSIKIQNIIFKTFFDYSFFIKRTRLGLLYVR